jgi:hypothetical protein
MPAASLLVERHMHAIPVACKPLSAAVHTGKAHIALPAIQPAQAYARLRVLVVMHLHHAAVPIPMCFLAQKPPSL